MLRFVPILIAASLLWADGAAAFGEALEATYSGTRICVGGGRQKVKFSGSMQIDRVGDQYQVMVQDEVGPYDDPPLANWEPLGAKKAGIGFAGLDIPLSEPAGNATRLDVWTGTVSLKGDTVRKVSGQRTIISFQAGASCQAVLRFKARP
jgi:hypothetical protein